MNDTNPDQILLKEIFESIQNSLNRIQKVEPHTASRWLDKITWLKEDMEKDARQAEKWSEMKA